MFYKIRRNIRIFLLKKRILVIIKRLRPKKINLNLIRIGGDRDGGYLLPDDLKGIKACFSPGVGDKCDFELGCADRGLEIYLADASVKAPPVMDKRFNFIKKFLGYKTIGNYITLEDWINSVNIKPNEDLLLQMDIEGSEFEVIESTSIKTFKKFRIIIIEFHNLQLLSDPKFYKKANAAFRKVLKNHFCVHIHPNNCCGIKLIHGLEIPSVAEFTFIRKDRVKLSGLVSNFPDKLDRNNINAKELILPSIWFGK